MALKVLHASDLQCGRPFLHEVGEAFLRLAAQVAPDVVVVAGDLTQRAKAREYRLAREVLGRLPDAPLVTTPGNHDVPLFRVWERLFDPFGKWRRFISPELDTVTSIGAATLVALNSAAPRRAIVNGRLDERQLDFARRAFEAAPAAALRCLVTHHHFVPVPGGDGGAPLPDARRWMRMIEAMGVDLVLGGHVHRMHIASSRDILPERPGPGVPIVACGTTTSRRGRGPEAGANSLTVVSVSSSAVQVTPYHLPRGGVEFEARSDRTFPRPRTADTTGVAVGKGSE